jgi:hypothetical protein
VHEAASETSAATLRVSVLYRWPQRAHAVVASALAATHLVASARNAFEHKALPPVNDPAPGHITSYVAIGADYDQIPDRTLRTDPLSAPSPGRIAAWDVRCAIFAKIYFFILR